MTIYYAHCVIFYNTSIEDEDIKTLQNIGFDVINPNSEKHQIEYHKIINKDPMVYFEGIVENCDALAFRSLKDGSITAGVMREINRAKSLNKPIIELPNLTDRDISIKKTREIIKNETRKTKYYNNTNT